MSPSLAFVLVYRPAVTPVQDEGILEYIDEADLEVKRTTKVVDSEGVLAEDQVDTLHQTVLRQVDRFQARDENQNPRILLRGSSSTGDGPVHSPDVHAPEGVEEEEEVDSDDDTSLLNPQPFAKLLARMGTQSTKRPGASAQSNPKGPKRQSTSQPVPGGGAGGAGGGGGGGGEEQETAFSLSFS